MLGRARLANWGVTVLGDGAVAQFCRFAAFGVGSGMIDFGVYRASFYLLASSMVAKALGYIAGTSFSVLANHRWTFGGGAGTGRIALAFCLYFVSLGLNVSVNQFFLDLLGRSEASVVIAFLIAVGVCTAFNFTGLRLFIFRRGEG